MGRDNSPKGRQQKELKRKRGNRADYDRILIVSEGSKTEPNYFHEIRKAYRLQCTNVVVRPSDFGTDPINVVRYAQELFTNGFNHGKNIQPRAFDKVYAVFDRDDHDSYHDALDLAESLNGQLKNENKQPVSFQAIVSVPCFKLWLLLHFEDIKAPQNRNQVMSRLKKHIPDYKKCADNLFEISRKHLPVAIQRAKQLSELCTARTASPELFTAIGELVSILTTLRD